MDTYHGLEFSHLFNLLTLQRDLNFRKCHFLVLKISGAFVNLSAVSKWRPEVTAYLVFPLTQVTANT